VARPVQRSSALGIIYLYCYLFILQKYTTLSKFISFDHQTPWRTAAAVGHGGWRPTEGGIAAHAAAVGHDGWGFFNFF
jgi:hypothetical protein